VAELKLGKFSKLTHPNLPNLHLMVAELKLRKFSKLTYPNLHLTVAELKLRKFSKLTHPNLHLPVAELKLKQHNLHLLYSFEFQYNFTEGPDGFILSNYKNSDGSIR